jgi:uncharacterized Zn finger protein (UPF0148 family)
MAKEIPPDGQRCTANAKSHDGRCKNYRKPGQKVCGVHGGEAPQNKRKAIEILREAVDPLTQKKVETARDAWEKYQKAKESGQDEEMAYWMEKFNERYEEVADRAGPPKVKRSEMTGEDGGPVETSGVLKVPGMAEEDEWEDELDGED